MIRPAERRPSPVDSPNLLALVGLLRGQSIKLHADDMKALMQLAADEGVEAMAAERLTAHQPGSDLESLTRKAALQSMLLEQITREVLAHTQRIGIPALLLKGNALAHWAYPQPHWRACSDVDILVPSREAAEQLAQALRRAGFERATTSGALVAFELMCTRQLTPDWKVEIDVHWRLSNSALFADRFSFDELMAQAIPIPALGAEARGLGTVHALLHAAIHRASNLMTGMGDRLKWLYDFVALSQHLDPETWLGVASEASQRQLAGLTLSALQAADRRLGLVVPTAVMDSLERSAATEAIDHARLDDWQYMEALTWHSLPGWGIRLRWAWQRLFPSRDYMAYLYGVDRSYPSLLLERLRRASQKLGR